MPTINHYIRLFCATILLSITTGCATTTLAQQKEQSFHWGEPVNFGDIIFHFNSVRRDSYFTNWLNQRTLAADQFVIIDVTLINKTGAPLPYHLQPIFRLRDNTGAVYEPDTTNTTMINILKPGRVDPGHNINPNTETKQELVFSVPNKDYVLQVIVPNRARLGFGGSITSAGPYFLYDINSQLKQQQVNSTE